MSPINLLLSISPHSMVDLITNSSTEIFTIQTDKTVEAVEELINELQLQYPNEYGHYLSVRIVDEYDIHSMHGWDYFNVTDAIEILTDLGYTVTKNENPPTFLLLSAERGGLHPMLERFIHENFNVIDHDTNR